MLRIGSTSVPVYNPDNRTKVPDILFYENPQVCYIIEIIVVFLERLSMWNMLNCLYNRNSDCFLERLSMQNMLNCLYDRNNDCISRVSFHVKHAHLPIIEIVIVL